MKKAFPQLERPTPVEKTYINLLEWDWKIKCSLISTKHVLYQYDNFHSLLISMILHFLLALFWTNLANVIETSKVSDSSGEIQFPEGL